MSGGVVAVYEAGHRFYTAQTMVSVLSELGIEEN